MKKTLKSIKSKPVAKGKTLKAPAKTAKAKVVKPVAKAPKKKVAVKVAQKPVKKVVVAKKSIKASKTIVKKNIKPVKKIAKPIKKEKAPKIASKNKNTILIIPEVKPDKSSKKVKNLKVKESVSIAKKSIEKEVRQKPARKSKGGRKPKNKDEDEDEGPVVEQDLMIEQLINSTKRLKKPSKVPKQLRTFTNPMASLTIALGDPSNKSNKASSKKEPKGKFELEYVIRTSAGILYEFLTSPSGLSEWFADDVNIHDGIFTFFWEGSEQKAKLLGFKEEKFIRMQWLDKPEGTYFEFRIERDELTGDISLMVVDFADEDADMKTSKLLWDSQINALLNVIGSY